MRTHDRKRDEPALSAQELDAHVAAELPEREAMSLVNANLALPINAAIAAKVLSDNATAVAEATQGAAEWSGKGGGEELAGRRGPLFLDR